MSTELEIEVPGELEIEPASAPVATQTLVEVLSADFALPQLIKFIPDVRLKLRLEASTAAALAVAVEGPEGLQAADAALTQVRADLKAVQDSFAEPADLANKLHKSITTMRGQWTMAGDVAVQTVGQRIFAEQQRLERLAADERRRLQAIADAEARAAAANTAAAAEAQHAPSAVVDQLREEAKTATAAPIAKATAAAPKLAGSAIVKTWKCRIKGTPGDIEQNPDITELNEPQKIEIRDLLRHILDGTAPLQAIQLNWTYLNKRAGADKGTFDIAGLEAYETGGVRGKARR